MTDPNDPHFPLGPLLGEFPFASHGERFILREDFAFEDGDLKVLVPAGFVTDFNSIPRFLWWWFPPTEYPEAGVVHDYLYRYPGKLDRGQVDRVHRRILELSGCRESKRAAAYAGLRAGGWLPWRRYRKQDS